MQRCPKTPVNGVPRHHGDPRIALSIPSTTINEWGLLEYLVVYGTARVTEGSAADARIVTRTEPAAGPARSGLYLMILIDNAAQTLWHCTGCDDLGER
jgi:hypothetical protein